MLIKATIKKPEPSEPGCICKVSTQAAIVNKNPAINESIGFFSACSGLIRDSIIIILRIITFINLEIKNNKHLF